MAKPILVINYCIEGLSRSIAVRNLRDLQQVISESSANDEYYVFLLPVREDSNIQVFYEKDFEETNYEALKKLVNEKFASFEKSSDSLEQKPKMIYLEEDEDEFTFKQRIRNFFTKW